MRPHGVRGACWPAPGTHHVQVPVRRYAALQELIPQKEKVDKATVLYQVVDYIQKMQVRRVPLPWLPVHPGAL